MRTLNSLASLPFAVMVRRKAPTASPNHTTTPKMNRACTDERAQPRGTASARQAGGTRMAPWNPFLRGAVRGAQNLGRRIRREVWMYLNTSSSASAGRNLSVTSSSMHALLHFTLSAPSLIIIMHSTKVYHQCAVYCQWLDAAQKPILIACLVCSTPGCWHGCELRSSPAGPQWAK